MSIHLLFGPATATVAAEAAAAHFNRLQLEITHCNTFDIIF
jgi:hypothetical protein